MLLPHGYCINWSPEQLFWTVSLNALVAISYFAIPVILLYAFSKRKDAAFRKELVFFSAFITACGLSHLMDIYLLWVPAYKLDNLVVGVTALLSAGTAIYFGTRIRFLVAIPTTTQLEEMNSTLSREIEEKQRAQERLADEESKFRTLVQHSNDLIVRFDDQGRRIFVNDHFLELSGLALEQSLGQRPRDSSFLPKPQAEELSARVDQVLASGKIVDFLLDAPGPNDKPLYYDMHLIPEFGDGHKVSTVLAIGRDVTQAKLIEEQLVELATTDYLTGLHNRRSLTRKLEEEQEWLARHPEQMHAVLIVDIDHFKGINDTHGHQMGDRVIAHCAQMLRINARKSDFVGRWGGEEFILVLRDIQDKKHAEKMANNLLHAIADTPFVHGGITLHLQVSIGVTLMDQRGSSPGEAVKRADAALYEAKNEGRNRVMVQY